jgi:4-hydroxybenzoate polyprenyltransferase
MRLKYILLLARPVNLIIVAVTMYITRYIVLTSILAKGGFDTLSLGNLDFSTLVLSALLITAAGNIINDYFDQRVDRINKPEKVIIGKNVNRKVAILVHQGLNILAFGLALRVAMLHQCWLLLLFPIVITFMLWWYSPIFKKKPLIGNLLVALCTASVPVFAVFSDLFLLQPELAERHGEGYTLLQYAWLWILGIAAFAFVLTMIREAVKDAQDEPGDRTERYQTIPILLGIRTTKRYVLACMVLYLCMVGWCLLRVTSTTDTIWIVCCLILPMLIASYHILKARTPTDFGKASGWIKGAMLGGLILMIALLH